MDNQYPFTTSQEERAQRRAQRIAARKARERRRRKRMLMRLTPLLALIVLLIFGLSWAFGQKDTEEPPAGDETENTLPVSTNNVTPEEPEEPKLPYSATATDETVQLGEELPSKYAILIDLEKDTILAEKSAHTVINPASMTKILTVLVAAEAIEYESQLEDTVTIDLEITDYCYTNDCSVAGFELNEAVPVRDLFYGTILPSGAEAALALAEYVAGSQEEFVKLMNEKVEELGLSDTAHFTNCIGLYDEENVCTAYDMAMIMKAALDNDLARQALTTRIHEIPANDFHTEGMVLSNWFLRKIEDHISEGIEIVGAKTGYVSQSGSCAASYAENTEGGRYICVTADTFSSWRCIKDHVQIYDQFCAVESSTPSEGTE